MTLPNPPSHLTLLSSSSVLHSLWMLSATLMQLAPSYLRASTPASLFFPLGIAHFLPAPLKEMFPDLLNQVSPPPHQRHQKLLQPPIFVFHFIY